MQIPKNWCVLKYKKLQAPENDDHGWSARNEMFHPFRKMKWMFVLGCYFFAFPNLIYASPIIATHFELVCDAAAREAANETGVPLDVLMAITRTETGRTSGGATRPWLWTVNIEGRGDWFDTKSDALTYVFNHFKAGARSFDIGCFQINYRWHGAYFTSIEEMFDPLSNARYAASFLRALFDESGNWTVAAGAFHSRTAVHADRYMVRFGSMLAELDSQEDKEPAQFSSSRVNRRDNSFPLLQQGHTSGIASLVPLSSVEGVRPVIDLSSGGGI